MEKTMENESKNRAELIKLKKKLRTAKSLLFILEKDSSLESVSEVYFDSIQMTHGIVKEVYDGLEKVLSTFVEECNQ